MWRGFPTASLHRLIHLQLQRLSGLHSRRCLGRPKALRVGHMFREEVDDTRDERSFGPGYDEVDLVFLREICEGREVVDRNGGDICHILYAGPVGSEYPSRRAEGGDGEENLTSPCRRCLARSRCALHGAIAPASRPMRARVRHCRLVVCASSRSASFTLCNHA